MITYGNAPTDLGPVEISPSEMMLYLYLPIKMSGSMDIRLPRRLDYLRPLVVAVRDDTQRQVGSSYIMHYTYLTAKTLWVEPGSPGNRPGWHADGYGSNGDLNYIWHDLNPTEFCVQSFVDVPDDDFGSLEAFAAQARPENIVTYPDGHLLCLDESVIHRVNPNPGAGVRTFIKFSVSRHRYNLKGNSRNFLFDYEWEMHDRAARRNLDNKDFVVEPQEVRDDR